MFTYGREPLAAFEVLIDRYALQVRLGEQVGRFIPAAIVEKDIGIEWDLQFPNRSSYTPSCGVLGWTLRVRVDVCTGHQRVPGCVTREQVIAS